VLFLLGSDRRWHRNNSSACFGLGCLYRKPLIGLLVRSLDRDLAGIEVSVAPAQRDELATAGPGSQADDDDRVKHMAAQRLEDRLYLIAVEDLGLGKFDPRRIGCRYRIACDHLPFDGMVHHSVHQAVDRPDRAWGKAGADRFVLLQRPIELGAVYGSEFLDARSTEVRPHVMADKLVISLEGFSRNLRRCPAFPAIEELGKSRL